jgi:hypothetical protein
LSREFFSDMTTRTHDRSLLLLLAMSGALATYVALHSPLRDAVASAVLGRAPHASYWHPAGRLVFVSIASAFAAMLAIAAALVAGRRAVRACALARFESPIVFGVCAFAFIATPAAIIGGLGSMCNLPLLRPPLGPLLTAVPALLFAATVFRGEPYPPERTPVRGAFLLLSATSVLILAASAVVSLTEPPTGFDALAYHGPLAVYLWRDGNLTTFLDRAISGFALAHPGSAELWFGLLLVAGGERVASLGQLPFALLGACSVYAAGRRLGAGAQTALIGAAAFLLAPVVIVQAGMQLNDVIAASLVLSAAALLWAPLRNWRTPRLAVAGTALGLALATKIAVLPSVAIVLVFAVARLAIERRRVATLAPVRAAAALVAMFVIAVGPWWVRNIARYGNPIYPQAIPRLGRGVVVGGFGKNDHRYVPMRSAWLLYPLIEPLSEQSGFGPLLIVTAVPGVILASRRRRHRVPLLLFVLVGSATVPAWWLMTQRDPRHLLVVAGFAFAFSPGLLSVLQRRHRQVAIGVIAAAGVFTAVTTASQTLLPRLEERGSRAEFYDDVWNIDPLVAAKPEGEPLVYNTGYASLSYAGDYPLLGPSLGRLLFTVDRDAGTRQIVDLMHRAQVHYAYVPTAPAMQRDVEAKYSSEFFELERVSTVTSGERAGTRRYLFRLRTPSERELANGARSTPEVLVR